MSTKQLSNYLSPAFLALSLALAAANWYLQPARALTWATSVVLLGCLTLAFVLLPRRPAGEGATPQPGLSISSGILWAGLIVAGSLAAKLFTALSGLNSADFSQRVMMAMLGALIVFNGNAIPKKLTPLSSRCDAARLEAFHRFAGWTWVLSGLALSIAWLILPVNLAGSMTLLLLPTAVLIIAVLAVRLNRTRQKIA